MRVPHRLAIRPALFALACAGSGPAAAEVAALDFVLAPPTAAHNTLDITVSVSTDTFIGTLTESDSATTTLSGNALSNLALSFDTSGAVTALQTIVFTGGRVQFDDDLAFDLTFPLNLASVDINTAALAGQLLTPAGPAPINPNNSFNLAPHEINVNEGTLTAVGGGVASGVNETFDFNAEPLVAPLVGSADLTVVLDQVFNGVGFYTATINAPFSFSETIPVDDATSATVSATGTLVANASFSQLLPIPGDANGDGDVGIDDLELILATFGEAVTPGSGADLNGNGTIDADDLAQVTANYGGGPPPAAPASVPEPASLGLVAIPVLTVLRRRRRA